MEKLIVMVSISLSAKLGIYRKVHLLGESKDRRNFVSLLLPSLPRVRNVSKKGVVQKYYVQSGERVKPFP